MKNVPKKINLIKPQTKTRCCKIRGIFWYHRPNKILYSEKYAFV